MFEQIQRRPLPLFPGLQSGRKSTVKGTAALPRVEALRGRAATERIQPLLARLAARSEQAGEADSLAHFLSTPDALKKTPTLLLIGREGAPHRARTEDAIDGAVLLFEYRAGSGGLRVFSTADSTGRRSVLAAPEARARVAAVAARAMVERGAQLVHISFSETHRSTQHEHCRDGLCAGPAQNLLAEGSAERDITGEFRKVKGRLNADWTLLEREIPVYLPLLGTYDATLARIGQRTRSNLRYYRRRSEADLGCTFVPQVEISLDDFLAFNRRSTYAVTDARAALRFAAMQRLGNGIMRGIRDGQGEWLSLVGARRQHGFAEIDWQMNRADRPSFSLGTVMRSYVIEQEIAERSTRLYIEGGTPHPIAGSFLRERVGELTLKRRSAYVKLLERFAPMLCPPKNHLAQTLRNQELQWRSW